MSNKGNIDLSYNGRLAKIEEQAEEIEQLKNKLELHIAAEDKGWRLYNDSLQKIEQSRKEKEWFIDKVVDSYKCRYEDKSVAEIKKILLTDMKEMLNVIEVLREE